MLPALLGGMVIGIAVAMLLLLNGRVAGISGILGGLVRPDRGEWAWRALFAAGLVAGGVLVRAVQPGAIGPMVASLPVLAVAGLLVGFGTRLAGGCTSGHGVCGVSRVSLRSIVATATFMGVAVMVVAVVRHGSLR
jgi:uncharacterized membrane protein YedE/YeeE